MCAMVSGMHPLSRLYRYSSKHRGRVCLATFYSVLNKIFDVFPEILIGIAVDVVVRKKDSFIASLGVVDLKDQLILMGVVTFFVWFFESIFQFLLNLEWRNFAQTLQGELRMDAYDHILKLEMGYFEDKSAGNLMSILNDDVNQLERFLDGGANAFIQFFVSTILIGGIFFYLAPGIAMYALLPIPIIIFIAYYFQKKAGPLYLRVRERAGDLSGRLSNSLRGMATVKSFAAEGYESKQLLGDSDKYREANRHAIKISSAFIPVVRIAIVCGFIVTVVMGGHFTLEGYLAVGSYSILIFSTQRMLWPFTDLAKQTDLFERAMASVKRILDLIETPVGIPSGNQILDPKAVRGDIEINGIHFAYSDGIPLFKDLSTRISVGQTVAFVGQTGSGKSSLIKLLLRFYDPQSGQISIDGQNIHEYNLEDLRRSISFVSQEAFLFQGTVRENIAYGSFGAALDDIQRAAEVAEAHRFIQDLPQGYDTLIGERGMKLSGGQQQRISIARAVLKDAPIFIFDEATSAVDNETEAMIQRAIDRISKDRTTIIIAHRLSTIRHADVIHVMDKGAIAESGKHEDLVAQNGIYANLWRIQTGG